MPTASSPWPLLTISTDGRRAPALWGRLTSATVDERGFEGLQIGAVEHAAHEDPGEPRPSSATQRRGDLSNVVRGDPTETGLKPVQDKMQQGDLAKQAEL